MIAWIEFANSQAQSRIELEDGRVLTKCDQCRQMWQERNERGVSGEPPCDGCWVDFPEENEDAILIFRQTRGQVITRGTEGVIVDINHLAVWKMIEKCKVKDELDCFRKVNRLFQHFLEKQKE